MPMIVRWPGRVPAGVVQNGLMSGLDWFPTLLAAAGNPNIAAELRAGRDLGGRTYRVYLDGYIATQSHFIAGLLGGREHETSGTETLKTMDIVWAGYRSADEGRIIPVLAGPA